MTSLARHIIWLVSAVALFIIELQSTVYRESRSTGGPSPIPFRFELVAALDRVEEHLLKLARLAHAHHHDVAFGLPSRAHEQFESARGGLLILSDAQLREPQQALPLLEPLKSTLAQLERIYELEHRSWFQERKLLSDRTFKLFFVAVALLTLLAAPLIVQLSLRLGQTMRRERRATQELEEAKQNLEVLALYDSLTELGTGTCSRPGWSRRWS